MPSWTLVCHRLRRYESSDLAIYYLAWSAPRDLESPKARAFSRSRKEIETGTGRWNMGHGGSATEDQAKQPEKTGPQNY